MISKGSAILPFRRVEQRRIVEIDRRAHFADAQAGGFARASEHRAGLLERPPLAGLGSISFAAPIVTSAAAPAMPSTESVHERTCCATSTNADDRFVGATNLLFADFRTVAIYCISGSGGGAPVVPVIGEQPEHRRPARSVSSPRAGVHRAPASDAFGKVTAGNDECDTRRTRCRSRVDAQRVRTHARRLPARCHPNRRCARTVSPARSNDATACAEHHRRGRRRISAAARLTRRCSPIFWPSTNRRHARRHLRRWMSARRIPTDIKYRPGYNRLIPQPLGVVGVVAPWNYPYQLSMLPAVAALAAGNRVMIKPSEVTR